MGVTCFDSEPDKWLGYQRRRDEFLPSDDRFMWTIDTFLDARSGYFFEMNPSGLMADSLFGVNGDEPRVGRHLERARPPQRDRLDDRDRDPVPHAQLQSRQRHLGHQLPAHRPPQERRQHLDGMGAQPGAAPHDQRRPRHRHHATSRRATASTSSRTASSRPRPSPGRGASGSIATATPASTSSTTRRRACAPNLTVNTDFAQTEVDQRQVNLTRFSLFFPERRDFFLDGATFFDFGSPTAAATCIVNPFFSRRIGLERQRHAADDRLRHQAHRAGGRPGRRLPARAAPATTTTTGFVGEDFTVARVKRRMLQQSYVGAHVHAARRPRRRRATRSHTRRPRLPPRHSTLPAASRTRRPPAGSLHATGPACSTRQQRLRRAARLPERPLERAASTSARCRSNFDPAVGFVTRRNYRRYQPSSSASARGRATTAASAAAVQRRPRRADRPRQQPARARRSTSRCSTCSSSRRTSSRVERVAQRTSGSTRRSRSAAASRCRWAPSTTTRASRSAGRPPTAASLALNGRYETGGFYSGIAPQTVARPHRPRAPGLHRLPQRRVERRSSWPRAASRRTSIRVVGETQFTPFIALVNNIQYDT